MTAAVVDIAERRSVVENQLDALRVSRGASLLDGAKDAASPRIVALEQELAALDEAETVLVRRQREEAADEAREMRARLVGERKGKATAYLTNFEIMETAAVELVDAVNAVLMSAGDLRMVDAKLGHFADIGDMATRRRIAEALGEHFAKMGNKPGGAQRFETMAWHFPGQHRDRISIEQRAIGAVDA